MNIKQMSEAQDAIDLIEQNRRDWLISYQDAFSTEYDKNLALKNLDRIDAYINKYFGRQKWEQIINI